MIGRYALVRQIGEGGFGTVWMAEQQEPVQRTLALKIIKLGMDTRSVVMRFEAERQALAMMDHPNIAKVYDGGATETGRPYFVMELVQGVPITQYCDDAKLSTRDRLVLFQKVCRAVQHAHQKGVIHRDLKPTNVLVGMHDGVPVPKVIDFGIAKATSGRLTEGSLFTEYGQMIGTPEYMAPEQAEASGLDVDTRADVYSLGAVLYELVTGTKAFDLGDLIEKGYAAIMRQIREVDPPRPSTRISTMDERITAIAERRRLVPHEFGRILRGDLDWIVMKALEKDRERRYDTAEALAQDIQRYLSDEAVLATPPSAGYRLRKFARRNRVLVAAGSIVGLALVVGAIASTLSLLRARDAEKLARFAEAQARTAETQAREAEHTATLRFEEAASARKIADAERSAAETSAEAARIAAAKAERVSEFTRALFSGVTPDVARGADTKLMRLVLDRSAQRIDTEFAADPLVAAAMHYTVGSAYCSITAFEEAERHLKLALAIQELELDADAPELLTTRDALAFLLQRTDRLDEALVIANDVLAKRAVVLGPEHRDTLTSRKLVGNLLFLM
ncbi:MAG: serine/threonine-protein kinase, partial [Planctomycetota bacterium]